MSMAQYGFHFHPPICGHGCNSCRYTKHVSGHWRLWPRMMGLVYKLKVLHFHRTLKTTLESKWNIWFHDTCCSTVLKWHDPSFASFNPSFDLKTIFAPASSSSWPLREKPQNRPQIRPMGHGNMGQNTVIPIYQGDLCGCDARNMMNSAEPSRNLDLWGNDQQTLAHNYHNCRNIRNMAYSKLGRTSSHIWKMNNAWNMLNSHSFRPLGPTNVMPVLAQVWPCSIGSGMELLVFSRIDKCGKPIKKL